jgi:hypothetical protein
VKITNKSNLPAAIVEAVRNDPYDPGDADITVTQLVGPVQIRRLSLAHDDEIEEDASDRIWALLGQAVHTILERANPSGIAEQRLSAEFTVMDTQHTVSGQMDRITYRPATLTDYKVTSAWTYVYGPRPEWIAQLNCYAYLGYANDIPVENLEIVALYRDWTQYQANRSQDYPQSQVATLPITMWPPEFTRGYMHGRLLAHFHMDEVPCTDEECWAKPTTYAVMKEGRKSALRVLHTYDEALVWAAEKGHVTIHTAHCGDWPVATTWDSGFSIEERPGEHVRCERYCPVADFCEQWARTAND